MYNEILGNETVMSPEMREIFDGVMIYLDKIDDFKAFFERQPNIKQLAVCSVIHTLVTNDFVMNSKTNDLAMAIVNDLFKGRSDV